MTTPGVGGSGGNNSGSDSPWARPSVSGGEPEISWVSPATGAPVPPPPGAPVPARHYSYGSQRPTQAGRPSQVVGSAKTQGRAPAKSTRPLVIAGSVLAFVLVVALALVAGGAFSGKNPVAFGPLGEDSGPSKPPLARLCPPASGNPAPGGPEPSEVAGDRLEDRDAGISYLRLGPPWMTWDQGEWTQGTLGVAFQTGYYFITESYSGGDYLASVLSGKVPATVGDSLSLNLDCAGRQVAEDVRRAYYPQPTVKDQNRDEQVVVGGRPAWVSTFHLTFQAEGLAARGEQVAVVLVDVGKPDAAVLYISIPDTHKQWDAQIDRIIASIRPA